MSHVAFMERAFALAKSGAYANAGEVERKLKAEGFSEPGMLEGKAVRTQVTNLCKEARGELAVAAVQKPKSKKLPRRVRPSFF